MRTKDYFRSVFTLREKILSDNKTKAIQGHRIWLAKFEWADPASEELVAHVEGQLGKKLPEDFAIFLSSVSNGAVLYRNAEDAMTGYRIYDINEFLEKQKQWMQSLKGLWLPQFLAIGEITSENRPLIMDTDSPTKDGESCKLMEGSVYDPVEYWIKLSQSFHEWIGQLITAQGAQYWLWR